MTAPGRRWGSYGQVLYDTEHAVMRAAACVAQPFANPEDAVAAASQFVRLRSVLARHVRLLVGPTRWRGRTGSNWVGEQLATSLEAGAAPGMTPTAPVGRHPAAQAWADAADTLGMAHDMLASHLGPDREPLTSDGERLLDKESTWPLVVRMASIAASVDLERSMLVQRLGTAASGLGPLPPDSLADTGVQWAAANVLNLAAHRSGHPGLDSVDVAPTAGAALASTDSTEPLDQALAVVGSLSRRVYDLARAGKDIGVAELCSYAALGADVAGHAGAVIRAARDRASALLGTDARQQARQRFDDAINAVHAAGQRWAAVYRLWSDIVGVHSTAPLVHHHVLLTRHLLSSATKDGDGWLSSADLLPDRDTAYRYAKAVSNLVAQLHPLAEDGHQLAERAQLRGLLLVPAAKQTARDVVRRPGLPAHTPLPHARFAAIEDAYADAASRSIAAATRLDAVVRLIGPLHEHTVTTGLPAPAAVTYLPTERQVRRQPRHTVGTRQRTQTPDPRQDRSLGGPELTL